MSVVFLSLAGCASPAEPVEPDTIPDASAASFAGTCASLLSDATISEAMDAAATLRDLDAAPGVDRYAATIRSGLECVWDGDEGRAGLASIAVFPELGAVPTSPDFLECTSAGAGDASCTFGAAVNGFWLSGILIVGPGHTEAEVADATGPLLDAATAALRAGEPWSPFVEPTGLWRNVDCAAVAAASDLLEQMGHPDFVSIGSLGGGGEVRAPGIFDAIRLTTAECVWAAPGDINLASGGTVTLTAHPGGGSVASLVEAGATEIAVDGVDRVVLVPRNDYVTVHAFGGANWVSLLVTADDADAVVALVPSLIAALDATAA